MKERNRKKMAIENKNGKLSQEGKKAKIKKTNRRY